MTFESAMHQLATGRSQPVLKSRRDAAVHYAMLVAIALLLGSLGLYVQNSINEMNANLENIHANLATGSSLGPD
jgi:hypothetical protein